MSDQLKQLLHGIPNTAHGLRVINRWALPIGAVGLAAVAAYNWRLWQQDKNWLAAKGTPPPRPPLAEWPALPLVSVLVAAWNEAEHIERHIESFLALDYPRKELILCAGGTDGTHALAQRYTSETVTLLEQQPGEGKQRALARSLPHARGEIVFLTDADCLLDDDAFERTLYPVAAGEEQVCTGGSKPLPAQMADPFAFTQAASQLYAASHTPRFATGILGRNCAVRRTLLAETAALDAPASTGTDYVLAKMLDAAGVRIRQMPQSLIPTEYPQTPGAYLRQQRRWLRNVVLHGRRFGAVNEVRASLRTSLVGLLMLLLPILGLWLTSWLLLAWTILLAHAWLARLRYLSFASVTLSKSLQIGTTIWQGPLLLLDFVAWVQPLVDYARERHRWEW